MDNKVIVLMSTYNGSKYIREQLDSILNQTYKNIEIIIRDDGSQDDTVDILQEYKKKNERIKYYRGKNIGPAMSFMELVRNAPKSNYFAFSDQDDVWKDYKIEKALKQIKQIENEKNIPILYFANTQLVDANLKNIKNIKKIVKRKINLGNALIENIAAGCTMVFNSQVCEFLKDIKEKEMKKGYLHDNLAYRIAFCTGKVIYDEKPCILYRQHGNNVIGNSSSFKDKLIKRRKNINKSINLRSNMANFILEKFSNNIEEEKKVTIKKVALYKSNILKKMNLLFDIRIKRMNIIDDIIYRIGILLGKI